MKRGAWLGVAAALGAATPACSVDYKDLVQVCEGKGISRAPAYDPGAGANPYLVFPAAKTFLSKRYLWEHDLLDNRMASAGVRSPFRDEYKDTPLTACIEQVGEQHFKDCDMGRAKLKLYHGEYQLTIRETKTAKVLHQEAFSAKHTECPSLAIMSRNATEEKKHPFLQDHAPAISAIIAKYLPEPVKQRVAAAPPAPEGTAAP